MRGTTGREGGWGRQPSCFGQTKVNRQGGSSLPVVDQTLKDHQASNHGHCPSTRGAAVIIMMSTHTETPTLFVLNVDKRLDKKYKKTQTVRTTEQRGA